MDDFSEWYYYGDDADPIDVGFSDLGGGTYTDVNALPNLSYTFSEPVGDLFYNTGLDSYIDPTDSLYSNYLSNPDLFSGITNPSAFMTIGEPYIATADSIVDPYYSGFGNAAEAVVGGSADAVTSGLGVGVGPGATEYGMALESGWISPEQLRDNLAQQLATEQNLNATSAEDLTLYLQQMGVPENIASDAAAQALRDFDPHNMGRFGGTSGGMPSATSQAVPGTTPRSVPGSSSTGGATRQQTAPTGASQKRSPLQSAADLLRAASLAGLAFSKGNRAKPSSPLYGNNAADPRAIAAARANFRYAKGGPVLGAHIKKPSGALGRIIGQGAGQDDRIPALLSDGEYVMDADIVAALGDGSTKAGAQRLDEMRENIRRHKRGGSVREIPPKAHLPEKYCTGGKK